MEYRTYDSSQVHISQIYQTSIIWQSVIHECRWLMIQQLRTNRFYMFEKCNKWTRAFMMTNYHIIYFRIIYLIAICWITSIIIIFVYKHNNNNSQVQRTNVAKWCTNVQQNAFVLSFVWGCFLSARFKDWWTLVS